MSVFKGIQPDQEHIDRAIAKSPFAGRPLSAIPTMPKINLLHQATVSYAAQYHPEAHAQYQANVAANQKAVDEAPARREAERTRQEQRRSRTVNNTKFYFHGTAADPEEDPPEHILPAVKHGGGVMHPNLSDPNYAYVTENIHTAQRYADLAELSSPEGHVPRVYKVAARGRLEQDPMVDAHGNSRDTTEDSFRSKHGFSVRGVAWEQGRDDGK